MAAPSASVYFQVVNNPSGAVFQGSNHTDNMFWHSLVATGTAVSLLGAGLATGDLLWVARGVSLACCLHTASLLWFLVRRSLGGDPLRFALRLAPEAAVAVASCAVCLAASPLFPRAVLPSLACKLLVLAACFCAGYSLIDGPRELLASLRGRRPGT